MADETKKPVVIAVVGPTASGKTSLSIELAKLFNGEVVCCDSRTIYKYMDIGTAKPTEEERQGIPHHMLDLVEPDRVYSAAEFQREGTVVLHDVIARGKTPIVCGGTGFYSRALLEGLSIPEVPPQEELRESLQELAENEGNEAIYGRLRELDPVSADKILPNDRFRIIRAIEVTMTTGRPFSEVAKKVEVPFDVIWIGLTFDDRTILRGRIEERMQIQMNDGLVEESRALYERYGPTRPLMNAVTYKQMINFFQEKWTIEEAIQDCIRHNYQLARKQMMWFRANQSTNWIVVDKSNDVKNDAIQYMHAKLQIT